MFANQHVFCNILISLGLADGDSDAGELNGNDVEMIEKEAPLPVCTKPFVVKKFRDALRRGDCITGKCFML